MIAVAGVTQAADADGVARELGAALGEIGSVVVVVDLDLRIQDNGRHRHERPGSAPTAGVADVLNAARTVDEVLTRGGAHQVFYIPAGSVDPASAQRLSTPAMRTMLDALRARFDYVLLACPPVVDRSESAVAAALAGSSLLIVESGATKRSELLHALELLAGVRVNSVSVAIDHVRGLDLGHTNSHLTTTPAPHEATPPTSASSGVGAYGGEHPSGRGQGPHAIG